MPKRPKRLQAARQQTSKDWWDLKRHNHELFTSQIVLNEIASGEAEMAKQRLATLAGIPVLLGNEEAEKLTLQILGSGLLPAAADRDAAHIALATIYEMDTLELELPPHRECVHSGALAKAGGKVRPHIARALHAG